MEKRENPKLQTKINKVSKKCEKINKEKIKHILEQLQIQRKKWRPHNRNVLCWSFYYVNDNLKINLDVLQMMRCLLCNFQFVFFVNLRKQLREGLISCYKTSSTTCLQKCFDVDHLRTFKKFQEEINNQGKKNVERQLVKKKGLDFQFFHI